MVTYVEHPVLIRLFCCFRLFCLFNKRLTAENCKLQLAVSISLIISIETRGERGRVGRQQGFRVHYHGNDQWDWNCSLQFASVHKSFINRHSALKKKHHERVRFAPIATTVLPYVPGVSEGISNILRKVNVRTIFKAIYLDSPHSQYRKTQKANRTLHQRRVSSSVHELWWSIRRRNRKMREDENEGASLRKKARPLHNTWSPKAIWLTLMMPKSYTQSPTTGNFELKKQFVSLKSALSMAVVVWSCQTCGSLNEMTHSEIFPLARFFCVAYNRWPCLLYLVCIAWWR